MRGLCGTAVSGNRGTLIDLDQRLPVLRPMSAATTGGLPGMHIPHDRATPRLEIVGGSATQEGRVGTRRDYESGAVGFDIDG